MVREFLGNIKGEKGDMGEKGVKGDKGETGDLPEVNANLIPMSLNSWVVGESHSSTTGEIIPYPGRTRLINNIPVTKGQVYTLSDESTYVSSLNIIRWVVYDMGEFVESGDLRRGEQTQIEMLGNEVALSLVPLSGFSNPGQFLEHGDNRLVFKLERGSKTKHLNVLKYYDRKIPHLSASLNGSVDMVIDPFTFDSRGIVDAHIINTYLPNRNTENLDSNGVFTVSKGCWSIDASVRMETRDDAGGYFTLVVYQNDIVKKRILKSANNRDSLSLSTTLFCDEGDEITFSIFGYGFTGLPADNEFKVIDASGANQLTMKKIGGL